MVNHFWQSVDTILEEVSVTETIVWCQTINLQTTICQCSKNYGIPTPVTRLKVVPNIANPISIKDSRQYPQESLFGVSPLSHSALLPWIQISLSYKPEIVFNCSKRVI